MPNASHFFYLLHCYRWFLPFHFFSFFYFSSPNLNTGTYRPSLMQFNDQFSISHKIPCRMDWFFLCHLHCLSHVGPFSFQFSTSPFSHVIFLLLLVNEIKLKRKWHPGIPSECAKCISGTYSSTFEIFAIISALKAPKCGRTFRMELSRCEYSLCVFCFLHFSLY